jgi:pimeloyl-ACP methyl ester carboxylesterase
MTDERLARIAEGGAPGGPVVVLLHGFGGSAAQWLPLIARLARQGAAVMAFDLPGHGGSLGLGARDARACADAVLAERAGDMPVHVVGHSFGGAVAALMALRAPDRIASLTLLSPGGFGPEIDGAALRAFGAATTATELSAALMAFHAAGFKWPRPALNAMADERAVPGQSLALAALLGMILKADGTQGTLPLARIAALPVPVTLLWGRADMILPVAQAELFPAQRRILLDGVGHMLHVEALDEVLESIMRSAGL